MEYENRTPHPVAVIRDDGTRIDLPSLYPATRVVTRPGSHLGKVDGVSYYAPPAFCSIRHLPTKREGVVIIVSQLAALAIAALHPERDDVVFPGTADYEFPERDPVTRKITAVRRLVRAG